MRLLRALALATACTAIPTRVFATRPLSAKVSVSVRETTLRIPTYLVGADDKNPPLWNLNVYPYPMQTALTRQRRTVDYRAVILENSYLRVIILPDLGGRIHAAHDKTNGDFDFIYHNHVIKPGLVALRGAWISGGIEWNFPTLGHTVNTFSPVLYQTRKNADGSVTCVVGTTEWVRRMTWTVAVTVFPNRADFQTRIRLFNGTLTHNNGYFWANAAAHAWNDTRVTFPPATYTFAGGRARPQPWPVFQGKDRSWYRNTPEPHDYFCGVAGDFHGSYNVDHDSGTVHCARGTESPGKKFWTWGTAPSGAIWEKLLTDRDGQYIELQGGRLLTQGDTWIFEPHLAECWDEIWYPVKKMGGLVKANPRAALNFQIKDGTALVACNTTRPYRHARFVVLADDREILNQPLDIDPLHPWRRTVPVPSQTAVYRAVLRDRDGHTVIAYSTARKPVPPPELQPNPSANTTKVAEITYLKGYYALKHWNLERAVTLFEQALVQDPGFTPALRALATIDYKTGRFADALARCNKVLTRNEDDYTARYYRALSKIKLGINERTEEDLYLIGRRAAYRHVAPYLLASLAVKQGDLARAGRLLEETMRANPNDLRARVLLAALLRHQSRIDAARRRVDAVLAIDPLNFLALIERSRLGTDAGSDRVLRDDAQYYLEAACAYAEMNLLDDAIATLHHALKRDHAAQHPLVSYYLGYYYTRAAGQCGFGRETQSFNRDPEAPARKEQPRMTAKPAGAGGERATRLTRSPPAVATKPRTKTTLITATASGSRLNNTPIVESNGRVHRGGQGRAAKATGADAATRYFRRAATAAPDYVFPFRVETEPVLRAALEHNPRDWKAHYYLGNLLAAKLRWREAQQQFLAAAQDNPPFATLYRNLGEIYWHKAGDRAQAAGAYEKAITCDPHDGMLYITLDRLYAEMKRPDARATLFAQAPPDVMRRAPVLLRQAQYYVDSADYDAALAILRGHTFLPWEGWTGAHDVYVTALHHRALATMKKGDYRQAITDLQAATEYPENLGTGRSNHPNHLVEHYYLGQCYKALGKPNRAREYFTKVVNEPRCAGPEQRRMKAAARAELKRTGAVKRAGVKQIVARQGSAHARPASRAEQHAEAGFGEVLVRGQRLAEILAAHDDETHAVGK